MTDMKTLKELMTAVVSNTGPTQFSGQTVTRDDLKVILSKELNQYVGTQANYEQNKWHLFELLSQVLTEMLPARVNRVVGQFADSMTVKDNQRVIFNIKDNHQRAKQFITRATPSGVYETFRLDRKQIELFPKAYGGAAIIDFERYLAGLEDIMEVFDIILEGLEDAVYTEIMNALMASWDAAGRPAANRVWANDFIDSEMVKLINTVSAYGTPIIYCTREFASQMINGVDFAGTGIVHPQDIIEIRNQGYIGMYRGTPIVTLPQSFTDQYNTKLALNPRFAFVLPRGNENIVKVVYEGDLIIDEWKNRDRSREIQGYRKFAVGILTTPNYWGIYYNAGIGDGGWDPIPNPNP